MPDAFWQFVCFSVTSQQYRDVQLGFGAILYGSLKFRRHNSGQLNTTITDSSERECTCSPLVNWRKKRQSSRAAITVTVATALSLGANNPSLADIGTFSSGLQTPETISQVPDTFGNYGGQSISL